MATHRTRHLSIALALIIFLLTGCAFQASSPGELIINDETERLSRGRVAEAAAPLLQRGATIAIFIVERGENNGNDLTNRLARAGLQGYSYDRIVPHAIAIYVSYEPRYSELRAGKTGARHCRRMLYTTFAPMHSIPRYVTAMSPPA